MFVSQSLELPKTHAQIKKMEVVSIDHLLSYQDKKSSESTITNSILINSNTESQLNATVGWITYGSVQLIFIKRLLSQTLLDFNNH